MEIEKEKTLSSQAERGQVEYPEFDTFRKENIAKACSDVAESFVNIAPQFSEDGRINYYLCGSFAQNLLPSVQKIRSFRQTPSGEIFDDGETVFSDSMRQKFLNSVRQKGQDYDVVSINMGPHESAAARGNLFTLDRISNGCEDAGSLSILQPDSNNNVVMIDDLGGTQGEGDEFGDYFYSVAELKNGREIVIASPAALIGGKAFELLGLKERAANGKRVKEGKIEKDESDLSGLCNGFAEAYEKDAIMDSAAEAMSARIQERASRFDEATEDITRNLKQLVLEHIGE